MLRTARRSRSSNAADGLCSRDDVPPLLIERHLREGVVVGHLLAERSPLPLTEEHLAEIGVDNRFHAEASCERRGGLDGATERAHVERGQRFVRQPLGNEHRLSSTLGRKGGVILAVEQGERVALDEWLGLTVADEDDLRRARRSLVGKLAEHARFGHDPESLITRASTSCH